MPKVNNLPINGSIFPSISHTSENTVSAYSKRSIVYRTPANSNKKTSNFKLRVWRIPFFITAFGLIPDLQKAGIETKSGKTAGRALKRIFKQDDLLSKIEPQPATFSLLMNSTRLKIFIHLCENPCDHTRSISRALETSLTTVNWHLGQLLEYDYIEAKIVNSKKLYWPKGMLKPADLELISCMRQEIPPKIIQIISKSDGIRQKIIVEKMQMKQQNIDYWLNKMLKCQLINKKGKGMGTTFHLSDSLSTLISAYDKSARNYSKFIIEMLYNDGLMPKNARFKGTRLGIDVTLPSGKKRLHLECCPMTGLRGYIK